VSEGGRTANNTLAGAAFTTTHPDLQPLQVVAPTALVSGQVLTVTWTTSNTGTGPALPGWTETVTLVQGDTRTVIGTVAQPGPLAAGGTLARRIDYTLPIPLSGAYQVVVSVDTAGTVAETPAGEANNSASQVLAVTLAPYADLGVSAVTAPALTVADPATVTVGWTVTNTGTGAGVTASWTDVVVASPNAVPGDGDDIVLGRFTHTGGLAVGASYGQTQAILLPPGFNGRYHLYVRTDVDGVVFENGLLANDAAQSATAFDVVPYPYADMVVSSVVADAGAASGRDLRLTWAVSNQGIGTTDVPEWVDNVYISRTADGANRLFLGSFDHLGFVAVGGGYTRSAYVHLPDGLQGDYYFTVVTPGSSSPMAARRTSFIYTGNDTGVSAAVPVALTPSPDLVVSSVRVPSGAPEGTAIDVSWTVANAGGGPALGAWTDRLVLHKVGSTDPGTVVGSYVYNGPLAAGQSYTRSEQIVLPLHISDGYEVRARPTTRPRPTPPCWCPCCRGPTWWSAASRRRTWSMPAPARRCPTS